MLKSLSFYSFFLVLATTPVSVSAEEMRFGLSDSALIQRFEAELNDILLSPVVPDSRTSEQIDDGPEDPVARKAIQLDPTLGAAWRADPKATLALLGRIRGAGGLTE